MSQRFHLLPVVMSLCLAACQEPQKPPEPKAPPEQAPLAERPVPPQPITCTLIGCGADFQLKVRLQASTAELQASTLTVCRNASCYSASLATLQPSRPGNGATGVHFPDPMERDVKKTPIITASVSNLPYKGDVLEVSYTSYSMEGARDGDVFDVTLTHAQGRKLVDVHEPVTYTVSYPNGSPQCGRCLQAVVDKS